MDFFKIKVKPKKNFLEICPEFKVTRSKDLMIRGRSFYAIYNKEDGLWYTDEYKVQQLIDDELEEYAKQVQTDEDANVHIRSMSNYSTKAWAEFQNYIKHLPDNFTPLDLNITFQNTKITRESHVSKKLKYEINKGRCDAYHELMDTLYDKEERQKLEWAFGSIIAGDSKKIQKFIVLYGSSGTGKSTVLNILQKLFEGYYTTFEAKALVSLNNTFATESFKSNPLIAIQHDGDLSKIEDNSKLNSIISHEEMTMNEKHKATYTSAINSFLFMGTNKPVKITDGKSGIIRRLIDVTPSGRILPPKKYDALVMQIDFELGAIAHHCLNVYRKMGIHYYENYKPLSMLYQTNDFFNFVEANYHIFKEYDGIRLKQAYEMYKEYCNECNIQYVLPYRAFREELKNYFKSFHNTIRLDGVQVKSYYEGFLTSRFKSVIEEQEDEPLALSLDETVSLLDKALAKYPAQYATSKDNPKPQWRETPSKKWAEVTTILKDLNTKRLHYVKPPINHIVIDFDLQDDTGQKSLELNMEAANTWPPTYAELSKGGKGIHLHYIYEGDPEELSRVYAPGIEIKVFNGNAGLRRKLSKCNNIPIRTISEGLPIKTKGNGKLIDFMVAKSEKDLRNRIEKNLKKEIHPGTKPSIDFIHKILEDAHSSGLTYDITDLRPRVLAFANNSSHQSDYCVKLVSQMKFQSASDEQYNMNDNTNSKDSQYNIKVTTISPLVFYDVEVFPNLFIVVWKQAGKKPIRMINPKPSEMEDLLKLKLVGFNNRRYDNHILYARYMGYDNAQLFHLSQEIINGGKNCMFREAYNLSYTDIYDFSSKKQSLKKFEIELGIHHLELGMKWDQPVPEELWDKVAEYCENDVVATEEVFNSKDRQQDFNARLILAQLSGLTPNDTTQNHTARIIFGGDRKPQEKFVYTDLSEMFPGYTYENGKSTYKGEEVGEGGYVYAEPGMYTDIALLDVASMHPTSLIRLNAFGPYTKNFSELVEARLAIKNQQYDKAKTLLNGILTPYLNEESSSALAYALKIVINIVYGLTSAKFDNPFKDPRNKDNIVAKRGALFMIDLKEAVQKKGFTVAHIKTDSIKIPNATDEIIQFVKDFGKSYGYDFDHEADYSKMCLCNDAVFIAKYKYKLKDPWKAVGAQFQHPYIFKSMFSNEAIEFKDMCETKSVTSNMYLDFNEDVENRDPDKLKFVGKVGSFVPIKPGKGGGQLFREKEGKYYAVGGTKGYLWLEAEVVKDLKKEDDIDYSYFGDLITKAHDTIKKYGDLESFINSSVEEDEALPF